MALLKVNDFVMLGRTFPQETKNNGITVCACGYSFEMKQFIRIYPLHLTDKIPKWSICELELEKPKSDNRVESWKVVNYSIKGKAKKDDEFAILEKLRRPSIKQLNELKLSLGVIAPIEIHCYLKPYNHDDEEHKELTKQLSLFSSQFNLYTPPYIPYIRVVNEDKSVNNLQIREWGVYEFFRKGYDPNNLFSALRLDKNDYKQLLIVGNMKQFRNNWLVISNVHTKQVVTEKKTTFLATNQLSLFSF